MLIGRRHLGAVGVVATGLDHCLEAQIHRSTVGNAQPAPGDGAATEAATIADVRNVGVAVGNRILYRHAGGIARTVVGHMDGEGHGVAHIVGAATDRLGQFQIDHRIRRNHSIVLIILVRIIVVRRRIHIMLIGRRHLGAVGVVATGLDHCLEAQIHRSTVGNAQPAPGDGAATEAATIADVRNVGVAVGNRILYRHAGGIARTVVGHMDGEGHGVAHIVGAATDRLGQFQIDHRIRRNHSIVLIILVRIIVVRRRIHIMLIGRRHLGAVGVVATGLNHRLEAQVHRGACDNTEVAPGDGAAAETAAIADGADVGIAIGHRILHRYTRGITGPPVTEGQSKGHRITHVVWAGADRLGQFQIDDGTG